MATRSWRGRWERRRGVTVGNGRPVSGVRSCRGSRVTRSGRAVVRVVEYCLDGRLAVEQEVDELLGDDFGDGFAADEYSVEHDAGIDVEEQIGVDIAGELTAGRRSAKNVDDGG